MNTNEIFAIWLPLLVAGLVQASFSLGVSMLTLLSGHLLSQEKSAKRLSSLSATYIFGSLTAVVGMLISAIYILSQLHFTSDTKFWSILAGSSVGVGLAVLLFYYRWDSGRGSSGTRLWLPRRAAEYLYQRTKATKRNFEAFILGIGSIVAELIFIVAPIFIAANLIAELTGIRQNTAIIVYVFIAILPLIILFFSNRRGVKISTFQKWREKNKKFLQILAGILLIVLGFYLFIFKAML